MFEKIKEVYKHLKNRVCLIYLWIFGQYSTEKFPNGTFRCRLIDTLIELGIGSLVGAIIIGKVAIPQLVAVSTSGWDAYSILLWGIMPMIIVAAMMMAIIYHVKYGAWPSIR